MDDFRYSLLWFPYCIRQCEQSFSRTCNCPFWCRLIICWINRSKCPCSSHHRIIKFLNCKNCSQCSYSKSFDRRCNIIRKGFTRHNCRNSYWLDLLSCMGRCSSRNCYKKRRQCLYKYLSISHFSCSLRFYCKRHRNLSRNCSLINCCQCCTPISHCCRYCRTSLSSSLCIKKSSR